MRDLDVRTTRSLLFVVAVIAVLTAPPVAAGFWDRDDRADMSFRGVFPEAIYNKSYFGWVILGTSIVAAAAISYATAGAGAPTAATGVSTLASVVGGGTAGSYMAGLSVIGGWVGGNAMVGAAILNGISLGLGGGGAAFATLGAVGKVAVLSSVTATALDGVLIFYPQDTKQLTYRIRLAVPTNIGSDAVQELAKEFLKNDERLLEAATKKNEDEWEKADDARKALAYKVRSRGEVALKSDTRPDDLLVLGVLARNSDATELGNDLIAKIAADQLSKSGYFDYLRAVIQIEKGNLDAARQFLASARKSDPYAIEPALLLVNLLGHQDFIKNEKEIEKLAQEVISDFDDDEYQTHYGLLALRYRMASMYFRAQMYDKAELWYEKAHGEISFVQKRFGDRQVRNLVRLGVANSVFLQGNKTKANSHVNTILNEAGSYEDKLNLLVQYVGYGSANDGA